MHKYVIQMMQIIYIFLDYFIFLKYIYIFKSSVIIHFMYFATIVAGLGDLNRVPDRQLVVGSNLGQPHYKLTRP